MRPLDALDLEALASGEEPVSAPDALRHAEACLDCGRRLQAFRALGTWLEGLPLPSVPDGFGERIVRLRGFSRAEKRSIGLWKAPALLAAALVAGSCTLLSVPFLGVPEQVGLLSALGLEWRSLAAWPVTLGRALPATVAALSDLLLRDRGFAGASILLMLPAGYLLSRVWARHAIRK